MSLHGLLSVTIGVPNVEETAADDADDLARAAAGLTRLGLTPDLHADRLAATEPVTGVRVALDVAPRVQQIPVAATVYNGPGRRAPAACSPGDLHRRRRSCTPTTWAP
jgi:hypothetical protein